MEFPLADEGPGDGGLAVVPGGHKANYPIPEALRDCEAFQAEVVEVNVRTGDVVIFAEATIHGTPSLAGGPSAPHPTLLLLPALPNPRPHYLRGIVSALRPGHDARATSRPPATTLKANQKSYERRR